MGAKAAFLDRDGTIIEDRGYLRSPSDVVLLPGAADGLRTLRSLGYQLVVVSNQSGRARGLISADEARAVHERMCALLGREGIVVAAAYYCPHGPDEGCGCRKPLPGLVLDAARDLDIDTSRSIAIGDRDRDLAAARAAGCPTVVLLGADADPDADAVRLDGWPALIRWLAEPRP